MILNITRALVFLCITSIFMPYALSGESRNDTRGEGDKVVTAITSPAVVLPKIDEKIMPPFIQGICQINDGIAVGLPAALNVAKYGLEIAGGGAAFLLLAGGAFVTGPESIPQVISPLLDSSKIIAKGLINIRQPLADSFQSAYNIGKGTATIVREGVRFGIGATRRIISICSAFQ